MPTIPLIFKICSSELWRQAESKRVFEGAPDYWTVEGNDAYDKPH